jgi:hypothetical protein
MRGCRRPRTAPLRGRGRGERGLGGTPRSDPDVVRAGGPMVLRQSPAAGMCFGQVPRWLAGTGRSGNVDPAGGCVEGICRGAVERDRRVGSVSPYQVDDLLEQLKLIFGFPYAATDDDAFPGPRAQGMADDRFQVVAAVEAEQAGLDADAVLGESSYADLDCVGYRLRVPGPGNPIRVKADHEDAGYRGCRVHTRDLTSEGSPHVAMWAVDLRELRPIHDSEVTSTDVVYEPIFA